MGGGNCGSARVARAVRLTTPKSPEMSFRYGGAQVEMVAAP